MYERIVAAIDTDPERSDKVIEAAQELARVNGSELLVAHVRELERPSSMVGTGAKAGAIPPALHFESEETAKQLVDGAVERLRGEGVDARGKVGESGGSTARELLEIAAAFGANLIVVGDRGSNVSDLLLGGVAHRIVHLAECPVLLVR
jgi:nucleotide-binding universal stress UspA family protein